MSSAMLAPPSGYQARADTAVDNNLDMDSLRKFRKIGNEAKKKIKKTKPAEPLKDKEIIEEEIDLNPTTKLKFKSIHIGYRARKPAFAAAAGASLPAKTLKINTVLLFQEAQKKQLKQNAEMEKLDVSFYKNYLSTLKQQKIYAKFEARLDNIIFMSATTIAFAGTFYLAGPYALSYALTTLAGQATGAAATATAASATVTAASATAASASATTVSGALSSASSYVSSSVYSNLMSETCGKFIAEVFFGVTPAQMATVNTLFQGVRTSATQLMKDPKFAADPGAIMKMAFNGKNPLSGLTAEDLKQHDANGTLSKFTSVDLKGFQTSVVSLTNFMIDRAVGPLVGSFLHVNPDTLKPDAAGTLFNHIKELGKADPNSAALKGMLGSLGIKSIGGLSLDAVSTGLSALKALRSIGSIRRDVMNFYSEYNLEINNIIGIMKSPEYTDPKFKESYIDKIVNRAKNSTVLRNAFKDKMLGLFELKSLAEQASVAAAAAAAAAPAATPAPVPTVTAAPPNPYSVEAFVKPAPPVSTLADKPKPSRIEATILFFRVEAGKQYGKLTPENFLGYASGAVYDSVANKITTGFKSFYPTGFGKQEVTEDEETKEQKRKEEEEYEEGLRKLRIAYVEKGITGDPLIKLMRRAAIESKPGAVLDAKNYSALEYTFLNIQAKTKELYKKGVLAEPFFLWGTTTSLQLFGEMATFATKRPEDAGVTSLDYYGFFAAPMVDIFTEYKAANTNTAFSTLTNDLQSSIQKIYQDTYENYIRKPLMDTDVVKYIQNDIKGSITKSSKKVLGRIYLGAYIDYAFNQIVDLIFDTLINLPINLPNQVVTDFQYDFYTKNDIYRYMTPQGWKFVTENYGGKDLSSMYSHFAESVAKEGWRGQARQLQSYLTYSSDELYGNLFQIRRKEGYSGLNALVGTTNAAKAQEKIAAQAALAAERQKDVEARIAAAEKDADSRKARETLREQLWADYQDTENQLKNPNLSVQDADRLRIQKDWLFGKAMVITSAMDGATAANNWATSKGKSAVEAATAVATAATDLVEAVTHGLLDSFYNLSSDLTGRRSYIDEVFLPTGSGMGIKLKGKEAAAFYAAHSRNELIAAATERALAQGLTLDKLDDAWFKRLAAETDLEVSDFNGMKAKVGERLSKIDAAVPPPKTPEKIRRACKDLRLQEAYTLVNAYLPNSSELKAVPFQYAKIGTKTYEVKGGGERTSKNPLGLSYTLVEGKTATKSFTTFDEMKLATVKGVLGDAATTDEMDSSHFIQTTMPNYSVFGGMFYKSDISANDLQMRRAVEQATMTFVANAGNDAEIDSALYAQLRIEIAKKPTLRANMALFTANDQAAADVQRAIDAVVASWVPGAKPKAGETQQEATQQAQARVQTYHRALADLAAGKPGVELDSDIIDLYQQRLQMLKDSKAAYDAAIASLPPELRAALGENKNKTLDRYKGEMATAKTRTNKLLKDLSELPPCDSNAITGEQKDAFNNSYMAIKDITSGPLINKGLTAELNAQLNSASGVLNSGCPPTRTVATLKGELEARLAQITQVEADLELAKTREGLDVSLLLGRVNALMTDYNLATRVGNIQTQNSNFLRLVSGFANLLDVAQTFHAIEIAASLKTQEQTNNKDAAALSRYLDTSLGELERDKRTTATTGAAFAALKVTTIPGNYSQNPLETAAAYLTRLQTAASKAATTASDISTNRANAENLVAALKGGAVGVINMSARVAEITSANTPSISTTTVPDYLNKQDFAGLEQQRAALSTRQTEQAARQSRMTALQQLLSTVKSGDTLTPAEQQLADELSTLLQASDSSLSSDVNAFNEAMTAQLARSEAAHRAALKAEVAGLEAATATTDFDLPTEVTRLESRINQLSILGGDRTLIGRLSEQLAQMKSLNDTRAFLLISLYEQGRKIDDGTIHDTTAVKQEQAEFNAAMSAFTAEFGDKKKRDAAGARADAAVTALLQSKLDTEFVRLQSLQNAKNESVKSSVNEVYDKYKTKYGEPPKEGTPVDIISTMSTLQQLLASTEKSLTKPTLSADFLMNMALIKSLTDQWTVLNTSFSRPAPEDEARETTLKAASELYDNILGIERRAAETRAAQLAARAAGRAAERARLIAVSASADLAKDDVQKARLVARRTIGRIGRINPNDLQKYAAATKRLDDIEDEITEIENPDARLAHMNALKDELAALNARLSASEKEEQAKRDAAALAAANKTAATSRMRATAAVSNARGKAELAKERAAAVRASANISLSKEAIANAAEAELLAARAEAAAKAAEAIIIPPVYTGNDPAEAAAVQRSVAAAGSLIAAGDKGTNEIDDINGLLDTNGVILDAVVQRIGERIDEGNAVLGAINFAKAAKASRRYLTNEEADLLKDFVDTKDADGKTGEDRLKSMLADLTAWKGPPSPKTAPPDSIKAIVEDAGDHSAQHRPLSAAEVAKAQIIVQSNIDSLRSGIATTTTELTSITDAEALKQKQAYLLALQNALAQALALQRKLTNSEVLTEAESLVVKTMLADDKEAKIKSTAAEFMVTFYRQVALPSAQRFVRRHQGEAGSADDINLDFLGTYDKIIKKDDVVVKMKIEYVIDDYMDKTFGVNDVNNKKPGEQGYVDTAKLRLELRKCLGGAGACPAGTEDLKDKLKDPNLAIQVGYLVDGIFQNLTEMRVGSIGEISGASNIGGRIKLFINNTQTDATAIDAGAAAILMTLRAANEKSIVLLGMASAGCTALMTGIFSAVSASAAAFAAQNAVAAQMIALGANAGGIFFNPVAAAALANVQAAIAGPLGYLSVGAATAAAARATAAGTVLGAASGAIGAAIGYKFGSGFNDAVKYGAAAGITGAFIGAGLGAAYVLGGAAGIAAGIASAPVAVVGIAIIGTVGAALLLAKGAAYMVGSALSAAEKKVLKEARGGRTETNDQTRARLWETARRGMLFFREIGKNPDGFKTMQNEKLGETYKNQAMAVYTSLQQHRSELPPNVQTALTKGYDHWYEDCTQTEIEAALALIMPAEYKAPTTGGGTGSEGGRNPMEKFIDDVNFMIFYSKLPLLGMGVKMDTVKELAMRDFINFLLPLMEDAYNYDFSKGDETVTYVAYVNLPFWKVAGNVDSEQMAESELALRNYKPGDELQLPSIDIPAPAEEAEEVKPAEPVDAALDAAREESRQRIRFEKELPADYTELTETLSAEAAILQRLERVVFDRVTANAISEVCEEVEYKKCAPKQEDFDRLEAAEQETREQLVELTQKIADLTKSIAVKEGILKRKSKRSRDSNKDLRIQTNKRIALLEGGDWLRTFKERITKEYKQQKGYFVWGNPEPGLEKAIQNTMPMVLLKPKSGGKRRSRTAKHDQARRTFRRRLKK
jgi:hypothetical protein